MNKKEIVRNEFITIKVSKEEKEVFKKYAEYLGLMPTRLARNILLEEATKNMIAKGIEKGTLKALKKYAEITNDNEILERFKKHENKIDD